MNSKILLPLLAACLVEGNPSFGRAQAADASLYFLTKGRYYTQADASGPVPSLDRPFSLRSSVILNGSNSVSGAALRLPNGQSQAMSFDGQELSLKADFSDKTALDAAYPSGSYVLTINTVHDGVKNATLPLGPDAYPNPPSIVNLQAARAVDAAAAFTLSWTGFLGGTPTDVVILEIEDANGNTLFSSPPPGVPGALTGIATSQIIPANTLSSGGSFHAKLTFAKVTALNQTSYPGVGGLAGYQSRTDFDLRTSGGPVGPPDARFAGVAKGQNYVQTASGAVALEAANAFAFSAFIDAANSGAVLGGSLRTPGNVAKPLVVEPDNLYLEGSFGTQGALDAAYPNGSYILTINTLHNGTKVVTLPLMLDFYPNAPQVVNYDALQMVNAQGPLVVTWAAMTGGSPSDFIQLEIRGPDDRKVFSTPSGGMPGAMNGTVVTATVPAGTLQAGQSYEASLLFARITAINTNDYPGALTVGAYYKRTRISLQTIGGGQGLTITTTELPGRQVNLPYATQLTAAGGAPPYRWSISSGQLPGGLSLDPNTGTISGTVNAAGLIAFVVRVTDSAARTSDQPLAITGYPPPSGFPIATTGGDELAVSGATDGTNYLVGIQGDQAAHYNITAQLLSATGALIGPRIAVGRTGGAPFAAFGGGNYLLVWEDDANYPNDDLYGQVISRAGQAVGPPFAISVAGGEQNLGYVQNPVLFDGVNFLVIWQDGRTASGPGQGPWQIYGQRVTPNGSLLGGEMKISANPGKDPSAAVLGAQCLVVWNNSATTVLGQLIDRAAGLVGANFVIDDSPAPSDNPASVVAGGGQFFVAFPDEVAPGNWDLFGRVVASDGTASSQRLALSSGAANRAFPTLFHGGGKNLLTWVEDVDGPNMTLKAQYFTVGGAPLGEAFTVPGDGGRALPVSGAVWDGRRFLLLTSGTIGFTPGPPPARVYDADVFGRFLQLGPVTLQITTVSLPDGQVNGPYQARLEATGGIPPYTWSLLSGSLPGGLSLGADGVLGGTPSQAGSFNFQVRVSDSGTPTSSATSTLALALAPGGGTVINFDSVNAQAGEVTGAALGDYLAGFGVTVEQVTAGTRLVVQDYRSVYGGGVVVPSSTNNLLSQAGSNDPVSFTLRFNRPLDRLSFTRIKLLAGPSGITHPRWSAHAINTAGIELSVVSENLISSYTDVAAKTFTLAGPGVASVRFDSDNLHFAAFSAVLLDDLVLESGAVRPALSEPRLLSNGQFQFRLTGETGKSCTILASPDLRSWMPLLTTNTPAGGVVLLDAQAAGLGRRFYRAVTAP